MKVQKISITFARLCKALFVFAILMTSNFVLSQDADLIKRAQRGDPAAQSELGFIYATGEGVTQDYAEALHWILLAAEQIGAASRCLDLTVEYTKQRVQFGRPIGSFQALKHRMADLYVAVESARAVVGDAIAAPGPASAALARLSASEAFTAVAGEAIQMHGGIAITWEHDIQLYFKRAYSSTELLGSPADQLRRLESEVF